jgi:poly(3-hydroxybutyrate) depolymerase
LSGLTILLFASWLAVAPGILAAPGENPADGRGDAVRKEYIFEPGHKRLTYELFVPTTYRASNPAPLVVLLHGWGSTPWQVIHYAGLMQEAEKRGYIVVAPFGYSEAGGYGSRGPGRSSTWTFQAGVNTPANLGELSEQDVLNVLGFVRRDYAIDPRRVYLLGHSMGGGGVLYLGRKYKGQWAALGALAPALYGDPADLADIRTTPIIVVQGELDFLVKVENTRRWVAEMKELGMDYKYIEIAGGDHIISIAINPGIMAAVFDFFDHHVGQEPAGIKR